MVGGPQPSSAASRWERRSLSYPVSHGDSPFPGLAHAGGESAPAHDEAVLNAELAASGGKTLPTESSVARKFLSPFAAPTV